MKALTKVQLNLIITSVLTCNDAVLIGSAKNGSIYATIGYHITEHTMRNLCEALEYHNYSAYLTLTQHKGNNLDYHIIFSHKTTW